MTEKEIFDQLEQLCNITTTVKIENSKGIFLFGTESSENFDSYPQQLRFKIPCDLNNYKDDWKTIWAGFGDQWSPERQLFRYLHGEFRSFIDSYHLYTHAFENFLPLCFEKSSDRSKKMDEYALDCEVAIKSVYEYGKHAIDLIRKIDPLLSGSSPLPEFCSKFSETRNKFLSHYHNPSNFTAFTFDPVYFTVMGTGQLFEVRIHLDGKEGAYIASINHRLDYFKLEDILINKIKVYAALKKN